MKFRQSIIITLFVLPLLLSCGRAQETVSDKPVLDLIKAKDGKIYALACLRDNGLAAMSDCEFNPTASQGARGFHNRWYNGYYNYSYWNPSWFAPSSWSYYWGFPNNWWTSFGYPSYFQSTDRCGSCLYAPRPGKCMNRISGCVSTLEPETN